MIRLLTILFRCLRLRCPRCGQSGVRQGWFRTRSGCQACGTRFEREPGFFLGALLLNNGLAVVLTCIVMPALITWNVIDRHLILTLGALIAGGLPLLFYPWARSLWLGVDELLDPRSRA